GAHFMNREPWCVVFYEGHDVFCTSRGEHLRSRDRHVFEQCAFVVPPLAMNFQRRDAPRVFHFLVEFNVVVGIWQAFAKTIKIEGPLPRTAQHLFKLRAESSELRAAIPSLA